jgi:8-oxo-dGTP pyrophosphatase MutT (NUDIX family)
MLVRDAGGALEVLLLRRSSRSAFAPDAFVFPGGTTDPDDYERAQAPGWDDARAAREFRAVISPELPNDRPPVTSRDAHALVNAAVREVAEEASLRIDPGALHLFSHWITPVSEPRRYDTHFFIAAAPPGQRERADRVETHDARWIAPAHALDAQRNGTLHMIYPTMKHLERLAALPTVDALLDFARSKPIITIMPASSPDDGFAIPVALEGCW